VSIPEPAALLLFGLGSLIFKKIKVQKLNIKITLQNAKFSLFEFLFVIFIFSF